jgi:hypothetical protein
MTKVSVVENQTTISTFLHSNGRHFHSTISNELNLVGNDKQTLEVQAFQIFECYIDMSPT